MYIYVLAGIWHVCTGINQRNKVVCSHLRTKAGGGSYTVQVCLLL